MRKLGGRADRLHQRDPLVVHRHSLTELASPLDSLVQTAGIVCILFVVALLGKGVFLFIQQPFGIILIEPGAFLGQAAQLEVQAGNLGIQPISDVFLTFAASELIQQPVIIQCGLDLELDRGKDIGFQRVLPGVVCGTGIIAPVDAAAALVKGIPCAPLSLSIFFL